MDFSHENSNKYFCYIHPNRKTNTETKEKIEGTAEDGRDEETDISRLFGTKQTCVHRCLKCNEEVSFLLRITTNSYNFLVKIAPSFHLPFQKTKTNILLVCNLLLGQNNRDPECMSFSQVLRNSLSVEKTTPAYCETCKKFTPTNQYAHVTELPQILSINCGLKNEKEMNFLKRQLNRNSGVNLGGATGEMAATPASTSTPIKPCRYGTNCSRVDCHFAHSDRKSPATSNFTANSSTSAQTTGNSRSNIWFPHHFTMEIDNENDLKIHSTIDVNENSTMGSKSMDKTLEEVNVNDLSISGDGDSDATTTTSTTIESANVNQRKSYQLTAVVCQIVNGNQKSLVALILVGKQYHRAKIADFDPAHDGQWYIFNDFR